MAKPPSELPAGDWQQRVQRYGQQINGAGCPSTSLLGAEQLVAKAKYEHEHSKLYSPIFLGAVLEQSRRDPWDPRSMIVIMDGLRSIEYLWILIQLGDEVDVPAAIVAAKEMVARGEDTASPKS